MDRDRLKDDGDQVFLGILSYSQKPTESKNVK